MPNLISFYHDELVQYFLISGRDEGLRKIKKGFIRHRLGWMEPVTMFIDFNNFQVN
jgi:hypothetical protein